MRASTVFALAFSLLIALAAVAGAKYAGLFEKKPEPAPKTVEKPAPTKVLIAGTNLYEGYTATYNQVLVRDLRPEEEALFQQSMGERWRDRLMPPMMSAAHERTLKRNVLADQVLLKEYFEEPGLPHGLGDRLEQNTRAINLSLSKDRAAGGALRVGEYVDVLLTSRVSDAGKEDTRTACIARGCKIVMKRNNPWLMIANDPDDKPVHFTIQANLYRAALIEYAQTHGQLTLLPSPPPAQNSGSFSDPASKEYATEDQRIEEVSRGERTVGDVDLARIFKLNPPVAKAPPKPAKVIQHLSGVSDSGKTVFPSTDNVTTPISASDAVPTASAVQPASATEAASGEDKPSYTFTLPSATGAQSGSGCKTCDEKKKAAEAEKAKSSFGEVVKP
jgi:Flp pilus assembly protein CpaB